jgi:hypothetical protein
MQLPSAAFFARAGRAPAATLLAALCLVAGCDSAPYLVGLGEPIVVHQADFKHGALPGVDADDDYDFEADNRITALELNFGVMKPGTPNLSVKGRVTADVYAVAIRILELGDGYWLRPVGPEDPTVPGELTFDFVLDVASEIEPGRHTLAAVAFDKDGHAGQQYKVAVCVGSDIPDNGNACNAETAPPPAVASLSWNADADLDLTIVAPDGTVYNRSNRAVMEGDTQVAGLDADGVTGCLADGRRRENFVWNERPGAGAWLAYANLFDACGKAAVSFELTLYRRQRNDDGTFSQVRDQTIRGEFLRAQANGGAGNPLYLLPIEF